MSGMKLVRQGHFLHHLHDQPIDWLISDAGMKLINGKGAKAQLEKRTGHERIRDEGA